MAKKSTGKEIANKPEAQLPAEMMDQMHSMADAGMSGVGVNDVIMPRLTLLQDLSPQVSSRKPEYVEGAEVGQIFNVATQEFDDEKSVIPCAYKRHHIEWKPNRGGYVQDHGEDESIMANTTRNDDGYDVLPNGNLIVPTGTWYCIDLEGNQLIIPMSRTQLKSSRQWMSYATSEKIEHPTNGKFTPPLFFRSYKLSSVIRDNGDNSWFVWSVQRGKTILELMEAGAAGLMDQAVNFQQLLESGEIKAGAESFGEEGEGSSGGQRQRKSDDDNY